MLDEQVKAQILAQSQQAHDLIEAAYRQDPTVKGDPLWLQKQRLLLADMAMHLLQTALKAPELETDQLKRNLYSILTIADQYIPQTGLAEKADELYPV
jgi:hypothetical protein